MFTARNGFKISKDQDAYLYSATFFVDDGDDWRPIVEVLPKINSAIEKMNLTEHAHISYATGLLTITFFSNDEISDEHIQLAKQIEELIRPVYEGALTEKS